jgi:hypothetical protein
LKNALEAVDAILAGDSVKPARGLELYPRIDS